MADSALSAAGINRPRTPRQLIAMLVANDTGRAATSDKRSAAPGSPKHRCLPATQAVTALHGACRRAAKSTVLENRSIL